MTLPRTSLPERWGPDLLPQDGPETPYGLPVRFLGLSTLHLAFRAGSPVSHLLLRDAPATAFLRGELLQRDGTAVATMLHPETTPPADADDLRRRAAEALDFGIGAEARETEQAILGWADALLDVLPQPCRLRLDRDRGGLFFHLGKGFWIARQKDLAQRPEAARPDVLRARARRLLEETHDGRLVRRQTLAWTAPPTAHEAMARRDAFARLQETAP